MEGQPPNRVDGNKTRISRRSFLGLSGATAAGTVVGGKIGDTLQQIQTALEKSFLVETARGAIEIKKMYDIDIDFSPVNEIEEKYGIQGTVMSPVEKRELVKLMREEIGKYPPELIKKVAKLRKIRGLRGFTHDGTPLAGLAGHDDKTIFYMSSSADDNTPHHELFHLLESQRKQDVHGWRSLNPPESDYYHTTRKALTFNPLDPRFFESTFPIRQPEGYDRNYSRMNESEDRATIAGRLIGDTRLAEERGKRDRFFRDKVETVKSYYAKWSNGRMSGHYWKDLELGKVDFNYWKKAA